MVFNRQACFCACLIFYLRILGLSDALADEKLGASAFQAVQ
jgi:hypothetical protein